MAIKLVHITPNAEHIIVHCARVSNPISQKEGKGENHLIQYLLKHNHWSPFEMASMCIEIETTRAISAQILRHRSFSFQEFSQRYAETPRIEMTQARRQDEKNRQNSIDDLQVSAKKLWQQMQKQHIADCNQKYRAALNLGIAKEVARMILPMASYTKLYMHGTIRSWIHYLEVRTNPNTQLEHREIANEIKKIFKKELPSISSALSGQSKNISMQISKTT